MVATITNRRITASALLNGLKPDHPEKLGETPKHSLVNSLLPLNRAIIDLAIVNRISEKGTGV
jgi:hypothetical protein